MREEMSRRSFLAALVATLWSWLGKRPPEAPPASPSPPAPPPAVPLIYAEPSCAAVTYMYSCPPIEPLPNCCDLTGRCATFLYDSQARLG